jgi:hypothetical protein
MLNKNNNTKEYSRAPGLDDLLKVCRFLNENDTKYIVIGGMAMINLGYLRATEDIDLIVESSYENQDRLKNALSNLPDKAINDLNEDDLDKYIVVKVADEIVIDLMKKAGGYEYDDMENEIEIKEIEGVKIPFASAGLLYKLKKDTMREKDKMDLLFLKELLNIKD